jgi:serine/threonine protein kinase
MSVLGRGITAKVYRVVHTPTNQHYAMKVINKEKSSESLGERFAEMIQNEVCALQSIRHINIVNIIATSQHSIFYRKFERGSYAVMYIVMELCSNGALFDVLFHTGMFEERLARRYFQELLNGLEAIHTAGFSHRDMKPENIILDDHYELKIADFGFAYVLEGREGTGYMRTPLGTEPYMAP